VNDIFGRNCSVFSDATAGSAGEEAVAQSPASGTGPAPPITEALDTMQAEKARKAEDNRLRKEANKLEKAQKAKLDASKKAK
jgi:hypothetical protein